MTSVQRVHPAKCDPTCRLKPALPWFKVSRRKKMVAQVAEAQLVESHRVVARRATVVVVAQAIPRSMLGVKVEHRHWMRQLTVQEHPRAVVRRTRLRPEVPMPSHHAPCLLAAPLPSNRAVANLAAPCPIASPMPLASEWGMP